MKIIIYRHISSYCLIFPDIFVEYSVIGARNVVGTERLGHVDASVDICEIS